MDDKGLFRQLQHFPILVDEMGRGQNHAPHTGATMGAKVAWNSVMNYLKSARQF